MKRLSFFNLLICLLCSISGSLTNRISSLEDVCSDDIFGFAGYEVNSFYRVVGNNFTLSKLDDLLLKDLNFDTWTSNQTELDELTRQIDLYNQIITNVYGDFFNKEDNYSEIIVHKWNAIEVYKYFIRWKNRIGFGEKFTWYHIEAVIFRRCSKFFDYIMKFKTSDLLEEAMSRTELSNYLKTINEKTDPLKQQLIFPKNNMDYYYNQHILKMDKFLFYEPNVDSKLSFNIFVPVYRADYDANQPCTPAKGLPAFYVKHEES